MPYKEKEIEKLYYSIGEVASMFNVNTSHIRFWSKEFDVIRPATNKKGNRMYTQSDIENFRKIYHLVKEKGYTLKGAKSELRELKLTKPVREEAPLAPGIELADNPVELPLFSASFQDNLVDKIAIRNSLSRMKASLLEIHKELSLLEN